MSETRVIVVCHDDQVPRRRRRGGDAAATSPEDRLIATLGRAAPADLPPVSVLGIEAAMEAMAPASKLAVDLDCWLDSCAGEARAPCPADLEDLVRYLRAFEANGKNGATLRRWIASLATRASAARHRRRGAAHIRADGQKRAARQLVPPRRCPAPSGTAAVRGGLDQAGGFTIPALLAACSGDVQGMRDAALLSLGYDAGLRVSEVTAVEIEELRQQPDGIGCSTCFASRPTRRV